MITRIVKMQFREDQIADFLEMFDQKKEAIRGQNGCIDLELLQDKNEPSIFFTYSHWDKEKDLNNYRHSELFGKVWKQTKSYFSERAEAWTVLSISKLT